jgi:hypothetical protein
MINLTITKENDMYYLYVNGVKYMKSEKKEDLEKIKISFENRQSDIKIYKGE